MLEAPDGGSGAMYAVQIESLEEFQQKLTVILQDLEADNNVMSLGDGASTYGDFPEGKTFAAAYEQTKQDLIDAFNEVTQLVNTMINVAGSSASKYKQTEADITAKFNAILQQYGDAPTSTTTTGTTTYYPATSGGPASGPADPGSSSSSNTGAPEPTQTQTTQSQPQTYATQSSPSTSGSSGSSNAAGNAA
ncbi:MAG TPA: hypothetical protein VGZ32_15775 [Actinocrinis sp.]|uniref:hypothetical protein n=1 Tax=Actinocrinis sp. TaxID=1920516 RepID=UPI002DDCE064|nr:hypothetical protein [Actinocrinis sp.]HEV3171809.1 hypothetical protein [Actinocrinis sp.]